MNENYKRFYSLDIVRGMAALYVLFSHWGGWTLQYADPETANAIRFIQKLTNLFIWPRGGIHPGVIVFIVLSGFCIYLPLAIKPDKIEKSDFWKLYALRRAFRILPVFWTALLLGIISVTICGKDFLIQSGEQGGDISFVTIASILGVSEILRFFINCEFYPGNGPIMTVGVEILLYSSYPFLFLIYKRLG